MREQYLGKEGVSPSPDDGPLEDKGKKGDSVGGSSVTRRQFLKLGLGAAAAFLSPKEASARQEGRQIRQQERSKTLRRYETGVLAGRKLTDPYAKYTGIDGRVPAQVEIDFPEQLSMMWELKKKRAGGNQVAIQTGSILEQQYRKNFIAGRAGHSLLEEQMRNIRGVLDRTKAAIDWKAVARLKRLNDAKGNLLREISATIENSDLVSYSLTELMPARDGQLNIQVLDFLLRHAGRQYVESIPAIFDKKTSFGPYQFTEYALYNVEGDEKRGASLINEALSREKIPGSVSLLRGYDHERAAFLFIIDNIGSLLKKLSESEFSTLQRVWKEKKDQLIFFAATAHHLPAPAISAARRWLDNVTRSDYAISCGPRLSKYALKTEANLKALRGYTSR
jgi:hypothetical protein